MMSSNVRVVRTAYGECGNIYPEFTAPVLFAGRVLLYANNSKRFREVTTVITEQAAEIADLVTRIGEPDEYYDFYVFDGEISLLLRMRFIEKDEAVVAHIDFVKKPHTSIHARH